MSRNNTMMQFLDLEKLVLHKQLSTKNGDNVMLIYTYIYI